VPSLERLGRVPAAHLLAGAFCVGLALALLVRETHLGLGLGAAVLGLTALAAGSGRAACLAAALLLAGVWWGSVRLDALDRSLLVPEIGRAALARVEVTGPARRSEFALRVPVRVLRFGPTELRERYGRYYRIGNVFVRAIGHPPVMRALTEYALPREWLMRFMLRLMGNLTDGRTGDARDKIMYALERIVPAS